MSTKDELILDIVEKTYDKLEKLDNKVGRIEIQQAIHDKVVADHSARSTASEARIEKLENVSLTITTSVKILAAGGTVVTFFVKVVPFLLNHL